MPLSRKLRSALVVSLAGPLLVGAGPLDATADPADRVPRLVDQQERPSRAERTLRVGTFNIMGSIHTPGRDRRRTVRIARQLRNRRLRLIGLQEVQPDQLRVLRHKMPRYRFSPGLVENDQGFQLQIAFRRGRYDFLARGAIRIPFNGNRRRTPWVRLRHEATGRRVSVIDIHNPSKRQEHHRDVATRREVRLFRRLRERGLVLLVGDANEKREFYCKVTGRTDARAANGGHHGRRGCHPPDHMSIDWLMAGGRFAWRDYHYDGVRTSDHAIIHARLTLR